MPGMHVRFKVAPEELLDRLTEAAYYSVLKHGFTASFADVALDLREALSQVMEQDVLVSESCGSEKCLALKAESHKVWSKPARLFFKKKQT